MCYAIPGKVVALREGVATVDYFGEHKTARNEIDALRPGDYIYAQGGYVIDILPEAAALEILDAWKEVFVFLRETDTRLSRVTRGDRSQDARLGRILDRAAAGADLADDELLYLLRLERPGDRDLFYRMANFLRHKHQQNSCCVHGIIELSNICRKNCAYCGIHAGCGELPRYRMTVPEILGAAGAAIQRHGFKALVLQSGEGAYGVDELAAIVRAIKERWPCLILISFGEVGLAGLERLYEAGARGLLMRFETSNRALFEKMRPGSSFDERLAHLRRANELGYLILTGGLVGLPGQTDEDIVRDLRLTRELNAEMVSFGPFLPSPGTPLAEWRPPPVELLLKTLALARLIDPGKAKILVTTALETLNPEARRRGLMAGANSVMLNVTPVEYRRLYSIYPNRAHSAEVIEAQIEATIRMLREIGRSPTDLNLSQAQVR